MEQQACAADEWAQAATRPNVWANALMGTAIISFFGNVGIVLYMFLDGKQNKGALNTMVAFAVGGLLGDVFLHLLPHASSGGHHDHHDHSHDHHSHDNTGGIWVLMGIFSFFLLERIVRAYNGGGGGHSHAHAHDDGDKNEIRPGAWLNLFADVQHNFVDGMAIAAAFQVSNLVGTSTMLGVLIHEIPHEMGDFAVLLNQGFSMRGALACQFVSSIGAFAGCLFGLVVGGQHAQNANLLSFTAGGFIYVALVDVLPELLHEPASMWQTAREFAAIAAGVGIMVWVGEMEAAH